MTQHPEVQQQASLAPYTTLRAGGRAEKLATARTAGQCADLALYAQKNRIPMQVLGWGSNILPSDEGVPGLSIINLAQTITVHENGDVEADSGCSFQELFLKTAQKGLRGLEFAVGIPGTLGGALVSNAGAYRSNVSEFLTEIEIVEGGTQRWTSPDWMEFSYRDSILRRSNPPACAITRVRLKLPTGDPKSIYDEARDYQRQRIGKQPAPASAGSFFKNVNDKELAERLPNLPVNLKAAGVIPAGFLIEAVGLRGFRMGGAMLARRHANFILNIGGSSASNIRSLATYAQFRVHQAYGILLEEEVLYLGDWSRFKAVDPEAGAH